MALATETAAAGAPSAPAETPLQIRDALAEDRESARELQRTAFSLPPGVDASLPAEQLRVAVQDGRVVSCLTLLHARLTLRGLPVAMGGLRHVATHPEEQNRGYASSLIRNTLQTMRRQGLPVSVLFPFSFRYYRKFGYELGGNYCHFWCRPNNIPAYRERQDCRPAAGADASVLAELYRRQCLGSSCSMERDAARWAAICSDPRYQTHVFPGASDLHGYAVIEETRDSYGGKLLRVLDLSAETPRAWRGLLGLLSQAPAESVEWLACARQLAASGLLRSAAPLREGFKPRGIATIRPQFQIRVTDLSGLLTTLLPAVPPGRFRLALRPHDDQLPENNAPLTLAGTGSKVEVRPARPSDPHLQADIRILSQILSGYLSPADAVSQDLARCSSDEALETAEALFPAGDPFLSELDRF